MNNLFKLLSVSLALSALCACSSGGGSAPVSLDANGKHPADWLKRHWSAYEAANGGSKAVVSTTPCSECHGSDLSGGVANVSCFSATLQGISCHANADHTLGHPAGWTDPTNGGFHGIAVKGATNLGSTGSCGLCHATDQAGQLPGMAPSCLGGDADLGLSCHATSPATNSAGCVSCHHVPTAGAATPDTAGAHAAHLALPELAALAGSPAQCAACHSGFGSGTSKHASSAFLNGSVAYLNLSTAYRAKTGGFSFVGGKCSGVSCHGGRQTPDWNGGSLDVPTACPSCHEQGSAAQTPQYNSYFSGNFNGVNLHQAHLALTDPGTSPSRPIFCTDCHNLQALTDAQHFGGLSTQAMVGAADTIGGGTTRITIYDGATSTCTNNCHSVVPKTAHWN